MLILVSTKNLITENSFFGSSHITRYSEEGELIWSGLFNADGQVRVVSMTQDLNGNILLIGYFRNMADLNPSQDVSNHTAVSSISGDIFVIKLDVNGEYIWSKQMGGLHHDVGIAITTDNIGDIYISGCYQGDGVSDFDPGTDTFNLTAIGQNNDDIFVSKLSSQGLFQWAKSMNGPLRDIGYSIATDTEKNIYLTGVFGGELVYELLPDTLSIISNGMEEMFLAKLSQNDTTLPVTIVNSNQLKLYPNPANSFLQISPDLDQPQSYAIFDINGIKFKQSTLNSYMISISDLPPGSYFVQIKFTDKIITTKIPKIITY